MFCSSPKKYVQNQVNLTTTNSNSQASFDWQVFSIGRSDDIKVTCDMEVLHTDECVLGTHSCDGNATCTNTDSAYTCACNTDFEGN